MQARGGRRLAALLAPGALLALACGDPTAGTAGAPAAPRPHVLLVSIDSLRPDHLGCYGYARDTSPVIDRLAAEGVRFETVVSPSSWTLPAHATLFTGLPPEGHGLHSDARALTDDALCLAEVLADHGYATAAFVGGPFLRSLYGFDQGFDVYDDTTVVRPFRESQQVVTSPALVELATGWLDARAAAGDARPFFLFLHLWDVHFDYTPPPPWDRLFDPDYAGTITGEDFELGDHVHRDMDPRDLAHVVALYDGEIAFTDHHLGRLLDQLAARGLLDDTVVAVTADHGEEFFEHGRKGHRKTLFDESLLVPLVLRHPPSLPAGRVVEAQVRLADVPLTLLALAGIPAPDGFAFTGPGAPEDLLPLIHAAGTAATGGAAPRAGDRIAFGDLHGRWTTVRGERFKYLRTDGDDAVRERIFDLALDPGEQAALEGEPASLAELRALLVEWKRRWARRPPVSAEVELDDEQQRMLRELGYIR